MLCQVSFSASLAFAATTGILNDRSLHTDTWKVSMLAAPVVALAAPFGVRALEMTNTLGSRTVLGVVAVAGGRMF